MQALFDPARHEPLRDQPWDEGTARKAIGRICTAAEDEFDEDEGTWRLHPQDEPQVEGQRSFNLYWGATGVAWALRYLGGEGAATLRRDYAPWIPRYPSCVAAEAAQEQHGPASYLFGESGALLLACRTDPTPALADRLQAVVEGNLHNPVNEPLWGNSGTLLAAIHQAEASGDARWTDLVARGLQALLDAMSIDPDTGTWTWQQDLYGRRCRHLGAGHGLAGNVYPALRAAGGVQTRAGAELVQRALDTLSATALRGRLPGGVEVINWNVLVDADVIAAWLAKGGRPLVQDCHGAPGIVCRLAGAPRNAEWDGLLRGAGELTWHAGPLAKGASLCHGTAGSAMACLKLWQRFGEPRWLLRARQLALHAAQQVEAARAIHGQGRHSLWTGDLGVACVLWSCIQGDARFPTLDHF